MERGLISVIIPVYNVQEDLEECLNHIIHQTYKKLEIIVINDGSTDDSACICDRYAQLDHRIRVIHKKNEGLGITRNRGIELATGEFIGFPDSDDYLDETCYEKLMAKVINHNSDVVYCKMSRFRGNKILSTEKQLEFPKLVFSTKEEVEEFLMSIVGSPCFGERDLHFGVSACRSIYRKQIIDQFGLKFESERRYISEDLLFNIDYLSHCYGVAIVDEALYFYRQGNTASLSNQYKANRFEKCLLHYEAEMKRLESYNFLERGSIGAQKHFMADARICVKLEVKYAKQYGYKNAIARIKKIVTCVNSIREQRKEIPFLTGKQKLFNVLVRYRWIQVLYLSTKIQLLLEK